MIVIVNSKYSCDIIECDNLVTDLKHSGGDIGSLTIVIDS